MFAVVGGGVDNAGSGGHRTWGESPSTAGVVGDKELHLGHRRFGVWLIPNAIMDSSTSYTFKFETKQGPKYEITRSFDGFVPDSASISVDDILRNFKR